MPLWDKLHKKIQLTITTASFYWEDCFGLLWNKNDFPDITEATVFELVIISSNYTTVLYISISYVNQPECFAGAGSTSPFYIYYYVWKFCHDSVKLRLMVWSLIQSSIYNVAMEEIVKY